MRNSTGICDRILRIFSDDLSIALESADTDLIETGLVDSLVLVDLLARLEKEFGAVVPIEDLEVDNFRSVARITELVIRTQASGIQNARG